MQDDRPRARNLRPARPDGAAAGQHPPRTSCRPGESHLWPLVRPLITFDRKLGGTSGFGVELGRMRPKEVPMRPPEVFVRELAPHEGQRLKRLSKRSKVASTRQP